MKLNIAFYTDTYLPAIDGVVTSILNFRKELTKRGHNVYIFTSKNINSGISRERDKVFYYPGITFKPYPQYNVALFPYNSLTKLAALDIDIIHAHTPFVMGFTAMMGAGLNNLPILGSYHTLINNSQVINAYYPKNQRLKKFTAKYLFKYVKFFYNRCNATTAPSHAIENLLLRYGIKNIRLLPNSIDLKVFNQKVEGGKTREKLGVKNSEKLVLYVGRLSREKRLEVLLKAAKLITKRNEKVKFVIVGSGPAEQYYKNLARRLNMHKDLRFVGTVDRESLPKFYAASDLFCLPSTFETQGIVSLEAMATGKPVVCADYLALKELVKNGYNGEKFRPGDYISCAKKIEKVLNDPKSYIRNAADTAKLFSTEKITDQLINIYSSLLQYKAIY